MDGTGQDLNGALGHLAPFAGSAADLAAVLRSQRAAVRRLIRDAGITFAALGRREAATRTLVTAGERVLRTTAARDDDLRSTLRALPPFLDQLRPTLAAARAAGRDAAPVLRALRPAAPLLAPTLDSVASLAPDLRSFLRRLDPVLTLARRGLPAATRMLTAARPLTARLHLAARDLVPVVHYLSAYRSELMQSWMNVAAATQPTYRAPGAQEPVHYLRTLVPFTVDGIVQQQRRLRSNRHNAYFAPRSLDRLAGGLETFDCANTANPQTLPLLGSAPPCRAQPPWSFRGSRRAFPHLERARP
jgi:ABC-type transporter Mla subunit MlaD